MKRTSKCMHKNGQRQFLVLVIAKSLSPDEGPHIQHLSGQHPTSQIMLCFKKTPVAGPFAIKAYKKLPGLRPFLHSDHHHYP